MVTRETNKFAASLMPLVPETKWRIKRIDMVNQNKTEIHLQNSAGVIETTDDGGELTFVANADSTILQFSALERITKRLVCMLDCSLRSTAKW